MRAALTEAGIDASTLGYIETHGTGTPLGDPVEINGLALALSDADAVYVTPAQWHWVDNVMSLVVRARADAAAALAPAMPRDTGEPFLKWLHRHGQTDRAIGRFWKPVLVSALNEDIDRVSVPYAAQVMRESFLKSRAAGRMGV